MGKVDRGIMIALSARLIRSGRYKKCTAAEWEEAQKYFNGRCAYCGKKDKLTRDHAIPANRWNLGLGAAGNIVPACSDCNGRAGKGHKDFITYCREIGKPEVITKIKQFMKSKGYAPLVPFVKGNAKQKRIEKLMDEASEQSTAILLQYVGQIEKIINKK